MKLDKLQVYIDRYGTEKVTVRALTKNSVHPRRIYTPTTASRRRLEGLTYSRKYRITSVIGAGGFDLFISRSK